MVLIRIFMTTPNELPRRLRRLEREDLGQNDPFAGAVRRTVGSIRRIEAAIAGPQSESLLRAQICRKGQPRAERAAANSARALLTHSRCSDWASESATMPAPAWTCMTPSLINAVLRAMQVSTFPSAAK